MTLSSSLLFIVLATILELSAFDDIVVTIALVVEGVLMCFIGQASKQKTYEWFGRATIFIALTSLSALNHTDWILDSILALTFITAFIYSIGKPNATIDKVWMGFTLFLSTVILYGSGDISFTHWIFLPKNIAQKIICLSLCAFFLKHELGPRVHAPCDRPF